MHYLPRSLFAFLVTFCCSVAIAEPSNLVAFDKGEGYEPVTPAQATDDPSKIEVIEFFWYGCPHCYRLEPQLTEWLKLKPENVQFIRQPAIFGSGWAPHARAYFVAEALGVVDKVHSDLFNAIQNDKRPLKTEDELAVFFQEHGVTNEEFRSAYNSFIVDTKMRQASSISARYGVTGVPAVIINGKYRTSGTHAKNFPTMIAVINYLIQKESLKDN